MTDRYVQRDIIPAAYDLLPITMRSAQATAMLLTIGLQESRFVHRRQYRSGPARGFWQFERNGIAGVLNHDATRVDLGVALQVLCYPATVDTCHAAVEHNDVLATIFARLLLWTVPQRLPARDEPNLAWNQYLRAWRPGKPHPDTWVDNYEAGWALVIEEDHIAVSE